MAAVVLTSTFYDDYGVQYSIVIYDKESTTVDPQRVDTVKGSIIVTDEGDDKNPFKRIVPKKMSWTILMFSPEYTADQRNAAVAFYEALTGSPEGRFYVMMLSTSGFVVKTVFRGKIIADVGDLALSYHRDLNLTATDGILQLKDIDYRPADYDDTVPTELIKLITFKDHFTDLLSRNDVVDFFYKDALAIATGTAMFTTSTNWTTAAPVAIPGDVFKYVAKKNTYFEQQDGRRYRKYTNCYDALVDLLTGPNMRMIFSDGAYHIEALGYQDNLTLVRYAYDEEGNSVTSPGNKITHDITANDDIYMMPTPSLVHIAPLKAVILKQNRKYNNILSGINMNWHRTAADNRGPHDMGYVIAAGTQLLFDLRLELTIDTPLVLTRFIEFEFEMKLQDYYLSNNPIADNIIKDEFPKEMLWTTTASTFKLIIFKPSEFIFPTFQYVFPLKGLSDEIPEDGNFIIRLVSWRSLDSFLAEVSSETPKLIEMKLHQLSRVYAVTNGIDGLNTVPDNTVIYELGDVKNSIVYEEKLTYHDTDITSSTGFNSLVLLLDVMGSTISARTTEWTDADMGETLPLIDLLLKQMLGMRKIPNRVVRCTLERKDKVRMFIGDRYALGSNLYIPLRVQHNVDAGSYQMSLWSPIKDYDGINIVRYDNENLQEAAIYLPEYTTTEKYGGTAITYYEKFTGVTDPSITTSEALGFYFGGSPTPDEIDARWTVLVNGVVQIYKDATGLTFPLTGGELNMGEYTCDPDNDNFWFAYNDNVTIIIKYLKP